MAPSGSERRTQRLRIRKWSHVLFFGIYVSVSLFFAYIQFLVGAIMLVAFAVMSAIVIRKSVKELQGLKDKEWNPGYGLSNIDLTLGQLQTRVHKLRIRSWSAIGSSAIFASGALFFTFRQNVVAALPLIGLSAISGLIIIRSTEEELMLRERDPEIG